jgi:hypothetical protein
VEGEALERDVARRLSIRKRFEEDHLSDLHSLRFEGKARERLRRFAQARERDVQGSILFIDRRELAGRRANRIDETDESGIALPRTGPNDARAPLVWERAKRVERHGEARLRRERRAKALG